MIIYMNTHLNPFDKPIAQANSYTVSKSPSPPVGNQHPLGQLLDYLQLHDYRFTTVSPVSHQIVNARPGNAFAKNLTDIFGWNRPFKLESISPNLFKLMQSADMLLKMENGWKSKFRVSTLCMPNQYILGQQFNFLHSAFPTNSESSVFFGPDTYRFAHAVDHYLAIPHRLIKRAVDIGTGSGAGLALLADALPEAEVLGVDINLDALYLSRINIQAAGLKNAQCIQSDLLNNVDGDFDLIIANPPYLLDKLERQYRHGGGQLGSGLSVRIVEVAIERLSAGGTLLLYTGVAIVGGIDAFLAEVLIKLGLAGFTFTYAEIDPDIFGEELQNGAYAIADRIAAVVLTAQKPVN